MFPRLVDGEMGWVNAGLQSQADQWSFAQRSVSRSDLYMNSLMECQPLRLPYEFTS